MREELPHQLEFASWVQGREHYGLFAEMRLGKTLMTIRWAQREGLQLCIVVAPGTVLSSWEKELFLEGEHFVSAYLGKSSYDKECMAYAGRNLVEGEILEYADGTTLAVAPLVRRIWVLINYEALRMRPAITVEHWDAAILDESTKIKNWQASITQICCNGFFNTKHRVCLSGLPAPEGPEDFFAQFYYIHRTFAGCKNFWEFRAKFFEPNEYTGGWEPKLGQYNFLHHIAHQKAFFKRRADCHIGSKKMYETRKIKLPPEAMKTYHEVEQTYAFGEELENQTQWAIVVQTWLARMAGGFMPDGNLLHEVKFKELFSLLEGELRNEQVVVWFRFNAELQHAYAMSQQTDVSVVRLIGETSLEDRAKYINSFQNGKTRVAFCQTKLGKMGIPLHAADTAIYASNYWGLEDRNQSEDRIISPVKDTPQLIIDLVSEGTVDEDVAYALADKAINSEVFMMRIKQNFQRRIHGF